MIPDEKSVRFESDGSIPELSEISDYRYPHRTRARVDLGPFVYAMSAKYDPDSPDVKTALSSSEASFWREAMSKESKQLQDRAPTRW